MPSRILANQTPLELLKGFLPIVCFPSSIPSKVFGSVVFVHIPARSHSKLEPRALKCLFMGYSPHQKGHICYHPLTKKKYVSLNVTFFETQGYFTSHKIFFHSQSGKKSSVLICKVVLWVKGRM